MSNDPQIGDKVRNVVANFEGRIIGIYQPRGKVATLTVETKGGAEVEVSLNDVTVIKKAVPLPEPTAVLLTAAQETATHVRMFEADWTELTDGQHGEYPLRKALVKLENAIAKAIGHYTNSH